MALTLTAKEVPDLKQAYDERELIEQAKIDPTALAELYRFHYQAIAAHVRRRVGNQSDADDVVAETFLAMVRYLSRYRWTGVPFRAWLYRIAANQVNHWARRRRRWMIEQLRSETVCGETRDDGTNHEVDRLRLALLTLAPRYQAVLSLYYLEQMSTADVAQALGCRIGTVKSRLARGREALRRLLEQ